MKSRMWSWILSIGMDVGWRVLSGMMSSVLNSDSLTLYFWLFDEDSLDGSQLTLGWQVRLQRWSSCNEPVLVIIMSALSAISGRYWNGINQTQVSFSKNIPLHLSSAAQGQCPASPAQPGESMYFCHANIGWFGASAVRPKCYLWPRENHFTVLNCYVMWWWLHICVILGWLWCLASVSWLDGVMSAARVTWRDAVRVIMQWSQLSALTTTRDLGLRGMQPVSGRCHAMPSYLQTAVQTLLSDASDVINV